MTGVEKLTGATPNLGSHWKTINWSKVEAEVKRLQMRIAKAVREGKSRNKVKCLQWILSHSYSAKLLAVRSFTHCGVG
jgi:RNA-directed DNA polymerase